MSLVRCAYCKHVHHKQLLPYDCPECGHDFKIFVKCPPGATQEEHEDVAREDRRVFDVMELAKEAADASAEV